MSPTPTKIEITDLLAAAAHRGQLFVGRTNELNRLAHLLARQKHNKVAIIGQAGSGKTSLLQAFVQRLSRGAYTHLPAMPYIGINTAQLVSLLQAAENKRTCIEYVQQIFLSLPLSVAVFDQVDTLFDQLISTPLFEQLFQPFLQTGKHRLLITATPSLWQKIEHAHPRLASSFEKISLNELPVADCQRVIEGRAPLLAQQYGIKITRQAVGGVMEYAQQFSTGRDMPDRAVRFFDEVAAATVMAKKRIMTREQVRRAFAERVGLPTPTTSAEERQRLRQLAATLRQRIRGQEEAITLVAKTIQSAWLGLRNPRQPFGSFLFLGPSGVGKTEMAKAVVQEVYGGEQFLLRLDMSEFSEAHTVHRLLGAPPGYIGYEAGGQLTDFVKRQPFSLILLDEIEKAHPSLFDIFLQVLDDGRLTDGHGETIDFTKTILIATSNIGSRAIVAGATEGQIMPLLLQHFRPEFINRFSAVTVFNPLSPALLLEIAKLEIHKIEQRLTDRKIVFQVSDEWLQKHIASLYQPLFGARPLKRFIEQTCEALVTEQFLNGSHD